MEEKCKVCKCDLRDKTGELTQGITKFPDTKIGICWNCLIDAAIKILKKK